MSKRNDLLEAALVLFNAYGYGAVGVDRIRDAAKASKMTLYKHFASKTALIVDVLALRHAQLSRAMQHAMDLEISPEGRLHQLFLWHDQWFRAPDFYGCMFIKAVSELPEQDAIHQAARTHKQWLMRCLTALLTELHIEQPELIAETLRMILDGAIAQAALFGPNQAAALAWQATTALLGRSLPPLETSQ